MTPEQRGRLDSWRAMRQLRLLSQSPTPFDLQSLQTASNFIRTADLRYGPLARRYPLQPARPQSDQEKRAQTRDETRPH